MRSPLAACALIAVAIHGAAAQQTVAPRSIPAPEDVKLANGAPGFVSPVLRPIEITPPPDAACDGRSLAGAVRLSLVIDTEGRPRNVILNHALGNDLDYLAVRFMLGNRFQPATLNNSPIAVAGIANLHLRGCAEQSKDSAGHAGISLHLRAPPQVDFDLEHGKLPDAALTPVSAQMDVYPAGETKGYTPPKAINKVTPEFELGSGNGRCTFSAVVDEHGLPQNIHEAQCSNFDMVRPATEAARKYRFLPATKDGMPVPVQITIELNNVTR
ncbi:MAG TPA: energy transducer TonB [Terracidiphilus sp.]|jgi:hypothetical protein|nr:energy transducer TonB [Terracidiphilus sp.]